MTAAQLIALFDALDDALEADRTRLSELDGAIGDGDHGVTMSMGFAAVRKALAAAPPVDPTAVFNTAAKSFLNAVGASAGPLYATAFMRAGAAVKGQETADLVAVIAAMARGIAERGKAQPGDKTMLDAWAPAAQAAEAAQAAGAPLRDCLAAAADAAAAGAETTRTMPAKLGRASRLGERALGHVDPGAASAATILATMRESA